MSRCLRYVWCECLFLTIGCSAGLQLLEAYEVPLTPSAIHEAFELGRRNDHVTAAFLSRYISKCSGPEVSCFIAQVEVLTPFAQVVDRSQRNATTSYTEQQASDETLQRGATVVVQITLMLPAAYTQAAPSNSPRTPAIEDENSAWLRAERFWQGFQFSLKQDGKVIGTRSVHNEPVYSAATKNSPSVLDGANVWLEYDAKDVRSKEVMVEVLTPESKTISTTFDLKKLR